MEEERIKHRLERLEKEAAKRRKGGMKLLKQRATFRSMRQSVEKKKNGEKEEDSEDERGIPQIMLGYEHAKEKRNEEMKREKEREEEEERRRITELHLQHGFFNGGRYYRHVDTQTQESIMNPLSPFFLPIFNLSPVHQPLDVV